MRCPDLLRECGIRVTGTSGFVVIFPGTGSKITGKPLSVHG